MLHYYFTIGSNSKLKQYVNYCCGFTLYNWKKKRNFVESKHLQFCYEFTLFHPTGQKNTSDSCSQ